MKREYLSSRFEPARQNRGFNCDPAEKTADKCNGKQGEIESIRDSVFNEPAITHKEDQLHLGRWIEKKRAECSVAGNLAVAVLAALLVGPFAIIGAFMAARQQWYGLLYIVVVAPVVEEILKQAGMIYLLEIKPYRVFAAWQFVFSALVGAFVFASIENLLYIHIYPYRQTVADPVQFATFRWTVCTSLHLACSVIASMGMIRVWKKQLTDGKAADLSIAFPYFLTAMVIHGSYNLAAIFFSRLF